MTARAFGSGAMSLDSLPNMEVSGKKSLIESNKLDACLGNYSRPTDRKKTNRRRLGQEGEKNINAEREEAWEEVEMVSKCVIGSESSL